MCAIKKKPQYKLQFWNYRHFSQLSLEQVFVIEGTKTELEAKAL